MRSGVHIVQVSIYNEELPDVDYWRRVQQVFEVLSPDEEHRIRRYREENANLSVPQNRGSIINKIIAARGYRSYLEVGTRFGENYNSVRCQRKESVDPVCVSARVCAYVRVCVCVRERERERERERVYIYLCIRLYTGSK